VVSEAGAEPVEVGLARWRSRVSSSCLERRSGYIGFSQAKERFQKRQKQLDSEVFNISTKAQLLPYLDP